MIRRNPTVCEVLERLPALKLDDAWRVGGCLLRTCWNVLTGHRATRAIDNYDLFYYHADDVSAGAEARVNRRASELFSDLSCLVKTRNQARARVWNERERRVAGHARLQQTTDGVDCALAACAAIAVRRINGGKFELYAPLGVDDIVHRVIRPNPPFCSARRDAYELKAERWSTVWPELIVTPCGTEL